MPLSPTLSNRFTEIYTSKTLDVFFLKLVLHRRVRQSPTLLNFWYPFMSRMKHKLSFFQDKKITTTTKTEEKTHLLLKNEPVFKTSRSCVVPYGQLLHHGQPFSILHVVLWMSCLPVVHGTVVLFSLLHVCVEYVDKLYQAGDCIFFGLLNNKLRTIKKKLEFEGEHCLRVNVLLRFVTVRVTDTMPCVSTV